MTATTIRLALAGGLLALALTSPIRISAQDGELVYISNVTGTQNGGAALTADNFIPIIDAGVRRSES